MAATIIVIPKKSPRINQFFEIIDAYITTQGLIKIGDFPRVYFTDTRATAGDMKNLVAFIKNTKNCNASIQSVFYTHNLLKG